MHRIGVDPGSAYRLLAYVWRMTVTSALALLLCVSTYAQTQESKKAETPPAPSASAHELTAADLEAFLDGMMPSQLERENIAGAVIAVVKDGKLLFAKGYGYSDLEKRQPVSPDATLFRPGSISKLFTWTSVMQLVEQGKLDLDKDVNGYIDFTIPPAYGQPITLRDIITHTSAWRKRRETCLLPTPSISHRSINI
jgi:CubicO group peptidase (beta-lactamase class C family)